MAKGRNTIKFSSGGGGAIPTLQQVTDAGAVTTNEVEVAGLILNIGSGRLQITHNFGQVDFYDIDNSRYIFYVNDSQLLFGDTATGNNVQFNKPASGQSILIAPETPSGTSETIATQEYIASELATEITKCSYITITQAVNLDDIETRVNDLDAAVVLKGTWSASSGVFPGSGVAQAGWSYLVTSDATVDGIEFKNGDRIICVLDNASTTTYAGNWYKADYTDRVNTVAGRTGNVVITSSDLSDFNSAVNALIASALASFKTTNFLDFTSSGQGQLDSKKPLEVQETIATSGTTNLDFSFGSFGKITQTGSIVLDGINTTGTKKIDKTFLIQGSTNPAHTITFPNSWKNLSGVSADSTKMNFIEVNLINGIIVYSINKYDIPDLTAPVLLKSSILLDSMNTIELLYSEVIDSSVTTLTSWFAVAGKTVSSVTIISNKVRVVVSVPFTESDTPLVTFTNQVTGNGIQDASGNKAPNFSQNIGLTTYRIDNFNRADSTTSINNPSDGGSAWVTPFGGVWGIASNKAYCFGANTTSAIPHGVYLESSESNVTLRCKVIFGTSGTSSASFLARYVDVNNYYLLTFVKLNTGQLQYSIYKVVAGLGTTIATNTTFGTWVSGTEYTFMVKLSGSSITLYNGTTSLVQISDSSVSGTKHGLRIFAGSGSTGNTDRFDDFGVYYG